MRRRILSAIWVIVMLAMFALWVCAPTVQPARHPIPRESVPAFEDDLIPARAP